MQIHFALSEPARWDGDERLNDTAIVHVTPGLDGVSRAVNEAERGLLPAEATVVVGQPLTIDPSRAPEGKGILWIQLQELPWRVKGDAAGELDAGSGAWTDDLRERYADRIQARLERHLPNLESSVVERVVLSPARPRAAERQPPSRRPVRRRALARPELPLAPVRAQPGARDGGRAALAHRREHLARAGPRRGLGHDRRERAAEASARQARRRQGTRARAAVRRAAHALVYFLAICVLIAGVCAAAGAIVAASSRRVELVPAIAWAMWIGGGLTVLLVGQSGSTTRMAGESRIVVGGRFVQGSDLPQPTSPFVLIPAGVLVIALGVLIYAA